MRWPFRPSILMAISVALALGAAAVVYFTGGEPRPEPRPVREGDREVAFLYPATGASTWERFVTAAALSVRHLQPDWPDLEADIGDAAFPRQTTAVPEFAISPGPGRGRLVFRWYKLTGRQKTADWVEALLRRRPPPLAVVGGNNSDAGRELAFQLAAAAQRLPEGERPLMLLTTATADQVKPLDEPPPGEPAAGAEQPGVPLADIYRGRTFRFCFSNRQMAEAVTQFLWAQDDLRPDADPVYSVSWEDDSYARDLWLGFAAALRQPAARAAARDWAWLAGVSATGAFPLSGEAFCASQFRLGDMTPHTVPWSAGSFDRPNPHENRVAGWLIEELRRRPNQRRPLLVLAAQSQPSRRFLRALVSWDAQDARRFVVATGDTLSFNTVYRDRNVAWPVQELPFNLLFFCHHNPIDAEAARQAGEGSGTEDLLLNRDIVEALLLGMRPGDPPAGAAELGRRLHELRLKDDNLTFDPAGERLFDADGNRRGGTGEHVVWLRPAFRGPEVLPEATLRVWCWRPAGGARRWRSCGEIGVRYDEPPKGGNGPHGTD
ncbi:MAG TPA: hypothetical protein VFA26_02165 [Gemmataceae bacterium]|nr:hypothetical protein [Gemmataceae bacterium]